ncbi:MAG: methyltransferase domain-containing protein [Chloroflexi bacterium]|nr:methyltransferase domain-containing protein [Chloroflexota bacterium]MCI0579774.1 methyltransferase domain-containing protein [Chloroflexota bacterium]MCI0649146.1 methyltransferase domain-containing protein [Chloroflexota bacterium]MCI0731252.1 methyltransferase domain-containing protein [Chloroflexota bacterium]
MTTPPSPQPGTTAEVRQAYDAWAAGYDTVPNLTRDLNAAALRRQTLELAGKTILEIGAGTGLNTGWLAAAASTLVALDLSAGMLRQAQARTQAANVAFVQADVTRPWPLSGPFDLVVANLVLEHVPDLRPVFVEARHVLRPGGLFYSCELHPYRQLQGMQARYYDATAGREVLVPAFVHSVSDYLNAALDAGFSLGRAGEWLEDGATDPFPRLISFLFTA